MTAALPIKHKPFNLEHAKAGAPISNRQGDAAYFVAHVPEARPQSRVVVRNAGGDIGTRHENGKHYAGEEQVPGDIVMTPLGYIDGEPVFFGDEIEILQFGEWKPIVVKTNWAGVVSEDVARWPAPPKVYPIFDGSLDILAIAYNHKIEFAAGLINVANAALRHALDAGQVITVEQAAIEARNIAKLAAERDMAIAKAVSEAVYNKVYTFGSLRTAYCDLGIDYAAIIAKVPA